MKGKKKKKQFTSVIGSDITLAMVFLLVVSTKINRQSQIVCDWESRERLSQLVGLHVTRITVIYQAGKWTLPGHPRLAQM